MVRIPGSPKVLDGEAELSSAVRTRVTSFDVRKLFLAADSSGILDLSMEREDMS